MTNVSGLVLHQKPNVPILLFMIMGYFFNIVELSDSDTLRSDLKNRMQTRLPFSGIYLFVVFCWLECDLISL